MKHVIIGTAGHVDHGKTTLIKALTGTDTDRLKEEQERGMTIDLGFASLTLPDGSIAGIVDVPGHERFLKNMLAGAGGVDIALLVIAADESVMPQTEEHLEILRLLDVKEGVIALTKADTVDREWLEIVKEDIRKRVEGTFLADAPLIEVDSIKGRGVNPLKKVLQSAVSRVQPRNTASPFRLPVDRVFTRTGYGTVVTGTLVAGRMAVGDAVDVLPQGLHTRIRGLQTHGKKQQIAEAGSRVAVNLAGVEVADLQRGAVLVAPGSLQPTQLFDANLTLLPSAPKPLTNRARVRVHLGTEEIIGRVQVLGQDAIEPGKSGYIQFRAETLFAGGRGDRFVLRTYSPMRTIAGGVVLDPNPAKHGRNDPAVIERLVARERGTPDDLLEAHLQPLPYGTLETDARKALGLGEPEMGEALAAMVQRGQIVPLSGGWLFHAAVFNSLQDRAVQALTAFHTSNPLKQGMPREELRLALGRNLSPKAYGALVAQWQEEAKIEVDQALLRLANFEVQLNPKQQALLDRLVALFAECGVNSPDMDDISPQLGVHPDVVQPILRVALDRGDIVRIGEGLYWASATVEKAKQTVSEFIRANGGITVSQFRDETGSTRKYAVPAMEYLDSIGFTVRRGDERVLAGRLD